MDVPSCELSSSGFEFVFKGRALISVTMKRVRASSYICVFTSTCVITLREITGLSHAE